NALKILIAAGKIYDKFAVFLDSFEKIGNNISTINTSYETAQNQLLKGKGNICKQLENFKELGAKTNKIIKIEQDEQMPLLESANLKTPILENNENLAVLEDKK
nr:DNA recombination protein RmuC [Campylobacter sp.]